MSSLKCLMTCPVRTTMSKWWVFLSYPPVPLLPCHELIDLMAHLVGTKITVSPLMIAIAVYVPSHVIPRVLLAFLLTPAHPHPSRPHPAVTPSCLCFLSSFSPVVSLSPLLSLDPLTPVIPLICPASMLPLVPRPPRRGSVTLTCVSTCIACRLPCSQGPVRVITANHFHCTLFLLALSAESSCQASLFIL